MVVEVVAVVVVAAIEVVGAVVCVDVVAVVEVVDIEVVDVVVELELDRAVLNAGFTCSITLDPTSVLLSSAVTLYVPACQ